MKTPLEKIRENLNPGDRDEWAEDQVVAPFIEFGYELIGYSHTDPIGKEESGVHIFVFSCPDDEATEEQIQSILKAASEDLNTNEYVYLYEVLYVFFPYSS